VSERLLLDFDAFFLEHRLCGDLDGDASAINDFAMEIEKWRTDVGNRLERLLPETNAARIFLSARGELPGAYLAVGGEAKARFGLTPGFYQYTHVRGCRGALTAILASVDSFVRLLRDMGAAR